MPPVVYIETSIPSFYFEPRTEPEMVARRLWTRHWWDTARTAFALVTSLAVVEELGLHVPELVTPLELGGEYDAN
jgi:hypothetical protein